MSLWQIVYWVTPANTVWALLVSVAVVAAVIIAARRHGESVTTVCRTALGGYFLLVVVATFSLGYDAGGSGHLESGGLAYFFAGGENLGSMEKEMIVREALANVLMFTLFPPLIKLSWPGVRLWAALCACAAFSFLIELSQMLAGGGRVADVDDFTLNSLGGAIGVLVFMAADRLAGLSGNGRRARHRRGHEEGATTR
ncbi:VanZ family protein [Streptomyces sp. NPDC020489]|uniref:VanZ family protein n=1 Tax=Streptomyces sp. NPDC020489 TaxID=3365077 RepID=UPI0037922994